ncbi:MAG: EI24 domain-containing protein [Cytophagales bacterium]|nr:EI24 domain-containing protein [Cytophagales bacterium]
MKLLLDSFWRAVMYCLYPRVMLLSLLPLLLLTAGGAALGYFFWSDAVEATRLWLADSGFFSTLLDWFTRFGMQGFRVAVAPLIVVALATPLFVLLVMWVVALMMTPALLTLVATRRFHTLAKADAGWGTFIRSAAWSLGSTLIAIVLMLVSIPLWFIPPLIVIVPPLIWGWLTYRVMSFDALASHASTDERRAVMRQHRGTLLVIGIVSGYLGALPSLMWALGAMAAVFAVVLLPIALWLYTLIFAFSSLWFIHYCLAALEQYRAAHMPSSPAAVDADIIDLSMPQIPHA